jgi:hypothetical protein
MEIVMTTFNARNQITEDYLVKRYCVTHQQAKRLLRQYGSDKAEIDVLLGAKGRTHRHRSQDIRRTASEVSFG